MRRLTTEEVTKLAGRKGVKKVAVENFLDTVTNNDNEQYAVLNLEEDAVRYKWNEATKSAIREGIRIAFNE